MRAWLGLLFVLGTAGAAHAACKGPPDLQSCDGGFTVMRTPGSVMVVGPQETYMQTPGATMFVGSNDLGQSEAWSQTVNQFGASTAYTWRSGGIAIYGRSCSGDACGQ